MSRKILIVDDDSDVRELLKIAITTQRDYTVVEAENGTQGLERMREASPDLVIIDLHMPELNGYQFVVRAQKDPALRDIPLFVCTSLTGDSRKSDEEWRQSLGVAAFQSKPFQPMDILAKIDDILKKP